MPKVHTARQAGTKPAADHDYVRGSNQWGDPFMIGLEMRSRRRPHLSAGTFIPKPPLRQITSGAALLAMILSAMA